MGCQKRGQWEQALSLLSEAEKAGLDTDVTMYSAATSAFEEGGQWQSAVVLLNEVLLKVGPKNCRLECGRVRERPALGACVVVARRSVRGEIGSRSHQV